MREHTRVALQDFHIFNLIQSSVVKTVLNAPFVDVIAYNLFCSTFRGDDAENARTATTVEHTFAFQVEFQQRGNHESGGAMRACAESHSGLDADAQGSDERRQRRVALLASVVDDALVANEDWVESLHLPSLVPVFLFSFLDGVADNCLVNRELADGLLEADFVEQIGLHIADDAVFSILKRLESGFCQSIGQQLA